MSIAAAREGRGEALARILPFAVYIAVLAAGPSLRDALPAGWDGRWLYGAQIAVVMLALGFFVRAYTELRPLALGLRAALEATASSCSCCGSISIPAGR
jgi:hypothetical protein